MGVFVLYLGCYYSPQILINTFLYGKESGWVKVLRRTGGIVIYISQLTKLFFQGMRETLTISTNLISISGTEKGEISG